MNSEAKKSHKQILNVIPFPDGPESSPFFGALASCLVIALGFTEDMPYFCDPKQANCIECGGCTRTTLQKHRNRLYHDYQSFTGVSFGWVWPEDESEYQTLPGWDKGWRWPDEFLHVIFGYAGLSWERLHKGMDEAAVLTAVRMSISVGMPVLMKLGRGPDWHIVTGYDEKGTLYGLDAHNHFDHTMRLTRDVVAPQGYTNDGLCILPDWFHHFQFAIIITGRTDKTVTYSDILARIIQTLEHPAHNRLENDIMARLDKITVENTWETAQWLLSIVGFPIEARWHAAESNLWHSCINTKAQERMFGMIRQYVFDHELDATHGTCWKIWAQLGVGTETGFALPPNAGELLLHRETQTELKRLFAIIFANDKMVLKLLREAADCMGV
jgi:hypothetical protein